MEYYHIELNGRLVKVYSSLKCAVRCFDKLAANSDNLVRLWGAGKIIKETDNE